MAEERRRRLKRKAAGGSRLKGGTWNVRGFGGAYARIDPYMKMECMLQLFESRGWSFCILTDLKFTYTGVRQYKSKKQTWK